jgi:microcystin-dependent protein
MSVTYPEPNDMPSNINQSTSTWFKAKTQTTNKTYEIKSNNSISPSTDFLLDCLFDGNTATNDPDHDRLLYDPSTQGNNLILWFKLPDSIKLEKIRMFNQLKITAFKVYRNPTSSYGGGTEIANITNAVGSSNAWKEYTMTNTSTASDEFLIVVEGWKTSPPTYLQIREMQFISAAPTISPPTVSFPTSPVEEENATVGVVLGSGATQWEYSVNGGVNWTSGGTSNGSFTLSSGTYGVNSIQVRNGDGTNLSTEEKNSSEIVVQKKFVPADALAQTSGLETYIESLSEVQTLKEVHELKYNTMEYYGGTNFWAYYSYVAASNGVIAYKTKLFTFSPDTNGWTEVLDNNGIPLESATPASISSNGLSYQESTLVGYTDIFYGFVPFQMNTSTASLASLKTLYDGSSYTTNNLSQVYNIWHDERDVFDRNYSNTTRVADVWIYVLTDYSDAQGNVLYETRKVKYTITRTITNGNATYAYAWTIPTDETTTVAPTINNTQYANIPEVSNYVLSYFNFDAYMITNSKSIEGLILAYKSYFDQLNIYDSKRLTSVQELWYKKSTLTPANNYNTMFDDIDLSKTIIELKVYGVKKDYVETNGVVTTPNVKWTNFCVEYNKNKRDWVVLSTEYYETGTIGSGENVLDSNTYEQILSNILYDTTVKIAALKSAYNTIYNTTPISQVLKVWTSDKNIRKNIMSLFTSFITTASYYTTSIYDRVINGWSFNNASESYNSQLAEVIVYVEFAEAELEGKVDSIKINYNEEFTNNLIVNVHNVWYNETTKNNTIVSGKMYHSYNNKTDITRLYFGIVDLSYDMAVNTNNYSVAVATFESKDYNYDGNNVLSADYKELSSYTIDVSFNIDTSSPIMINNNIIKSQFDASYTEINTQESIKQIHQVWLKNGTVVGNNMNYTAPMQDMWVYYSYFNSSNIIEYESRNLNYNLQLNIWNLNSNDNIESATVRTTGLENTDLTSYTKIFEELPAVPVFSTNMAKSITSIVQLQGECVNDASITEINPNNILIENLYYKVSEKAQKTVSCIAHISYNPHKIFTLTYDNDTKEYTIPGNRIMEEIQDISSFTVDTTGYILFYRKPTGTSLTGEGIRYFDNTVQTTAMPPLGIIIQHIESSIPDNWVECNGAEITLANSPEYTDLSNLIGITYGGTKDIDNSILTFNLPDLRERYPLGYDSGISDVKWNTTNRTGGNNSIESSQFVHQHYVGTGTLRTGYSKFSNINSGSGQTRMSSYEKYNTTTYTDTGYTRSGNTTYEHDEQTDYNPSFIRVRYIIRYKMN